MRAHTIIHTYARTQAPKGAKKRPRTPVDANAAAALADEEQRVSAS